MAREDGRRYSRKCWSVLTAASRESLTTIDRRSGLGLSGNEKFPGMRPFIQSKQVLAQKHVLGCDEFQPMWVPVGIREENSDVDDVLRIPFLFQVSGWYHRLLISCIDKR